MGNNYFDGLSKIFLLLVEYWAFCLWGFAYWTFGRFFYPFCYALLVICVVAFQLYKSFSFLKLAIADSA
jgi:hypothetical protein